MLHELRLSQGTPVRLTQSGVNFAIAAHRGPRDNGAVVDWGAGTYEKTAADLEPVAQAVVTQARIAPDEMVVDVACGTGNAALLAAARGARVVGVDGAARLLEVARDRARAADLAVDFRHGDLHALPIDDEAADVVVSVFGIIFATDPLQALREVARVLDPGGRALLTAWIPEGPIDAMLTVRNQILGRVMQGPPQKRFGWADREVLAGAAAEAGLSLATTTRGELPVRAASPEQYIDGAQDHPMALAARPLVARAGIADELREAMTAVLRAGNEEPDAFLVHNPYVVHELRVA